MDSQINISHEHHEEQLTFKYKVIVSLSNFMHVYVSCEKQLGERWSVLNNKGVWRCYITQNDKIDYFFIHIEDAIWFKLTHGS